MAGGEPVLTLERTKIIRAVLCLFGVPVALLLGWGAIALAGDKEPVGAVIVGALAVATGVLVVWRFRRESARSTRLYEDRIERFDGVRTRTLAWAEVREIWFRAIKVQAGGLIGAAVSAAVDATRKDNPAPLSERSSSITVRLVGPATVVKLTSNDRGVVAAFEEILRRVNPRLVADAVRTIRAGQAARFGKVSLSVAGLAIGHRTPVPFSDVQSLTIQKGRLVLKKQGAWLAAAAVPIQKIPNVFSLLEAYRSVTYTSTGAKPALGRELAQQQFL